MRRGRAEARRRRAGEVSRGETQERGMGRACIAYAMLWRACSCLRSLGGSIGFEKNAIICVDGGGAYEALRGMPY